MELPTESAARPATRRYLARKDRIVAEASRILNETGIDGFTLARVADAVGRHPATLGYYWRKDTLIEACVLDAANRIRAMAEAALEAETPKARVGRFLDLYFEERRRIWRGEAAPYADFAEVRRAGRAAFDGYTAMFRAIARLFKGAPGAPRTRDAAPWARLVIEEIGWSLAWVRPKSDADFAAAARVMADFLAEGVAAPGERWPAPSLTEFAAPTVDVATAPREAFLAAATQIMNEAGYRGASVDRISARLGRTKGAFYHHHADKDEVIEACFRRTFSIMDEVMRQAAEGRTGWDRLAFAATTLAICHNSPSGRMLRSYALAGLPPRLRAEMAAGFLAAADGFSRFIEAGVADGSIRPVEPGPVAQMISALVNSSAYLSTWAPQIGRDAVVGDYVRPILLGLMRET